MRVAAKITMVMSTVVVTSGILLLSESELSRPDYARAAVPPPVPSQKKVIVKNLRMV